MKKWGEVALGVVTSMGGFLEVGSIATSIQAGAAFGFQLAWALALGTISLALLMEMTGRLAAVSGRSYVDLLREHMGVRFFLIPLVAVLVPSFMVLVSEIGGVAIGLQMATGIGFQWWAIPIAFFGWLLLWRGTFKMVENGTAILGLTSVVFLVAALLLKPDWSAVGAGLIPSAPDHDKASYWYIAVSILGASISPYLFLFYSSGALEDGWSVEYLNVNRLTAGLGNLFGGGLALTVLLCSAMVFMPRSLEADAYEQISLVLASPLGRGGFSLFLITLCTTCFGATVEITLAGAYLVAQGLGWPWSENMKPARDARFAATYTVLIVLAAVPIALGADPLRLTNISMVVSAASLPVTVIPLIVLMNDRRVMTSHSNGWFSNIALVLLALMSLVLFLAAMPLRWFGGA
jgi:Mn2+/Fe2+ NRAMP family transporter